MYVYYTRLRVHFNAQWTRPKKTAKKCLFSLVCKCMYVCMCVCACVSMCYSNHKHAHEKLTRSSTTSEAWRSSLSVSPNNHPCLDTGNINLHQGTRNFSAATAQLSAVSPSRPCNQITVAEWDRDAAKISTLVISDWLSGCCGFLSQNVDAPAGGSSLGALFERRFFPWAVFEKVELSSDACKDSAACPWHALTPFLAAEELRAHRDETLSLYMPKNLVSLPKNVSLDCAEKWTKAWDLSKDAGTVLDVPNNPVRMRATRNDLCRNPWKRMVWKRRPAENCFFSTLTWIFRVSFRRPKCSAFHARNRLPAHIFEFCGLDLDLTNDSDSAFIAWRNWDTANTDC